MCAYIFIVDPMQCAIILILFQIITINENPEQHSKVSTYNNTINLYLSLYSRTEPCYVNKSIRTANERTSNGVKATATITRLFSPCHHWQKCKRIANFMARSFINYIRFIHISLKSFFCLKIIRLGNFRS